MKNILNNFKELLDFKKKYENQRSKLKNKLNDMSVSDINKILDKIQCRYSYDKNAHFQIEEGKEKNSNCTFDTIYEFKCQNCNTKDQCYLHWKNRKTYSKQSVINFIEDMLESELNI